MIVPYSHVLFLAGVLFAMGVVCAVARRNLIMMLIGVEIMLNSAGLLCCCCPALAAVGRAGVCVVHLCHRSG